MGYDLTRQSMVWTLLMFVLLMLLFWARSLLYPVEVTLSTVGEMPPGVMVDGFSESYPRWGAALAAGFMLAGGLALCRVVTRNMILLERIYMPLQIYLIVACGSYFDPASLSVPLLSLLLVFASDRLIESFRRVRLYGKSFNGAFLLGCMPLLYAPAAVSLPVLVAALAVFKKQWREWVVALSGYLLPLAFASYLYWGAGYDFLWLGRLAVDGIRDYLTLPEGAFFRTWNDPALLVFWGIWAAITVWAVLTFFLTARTMRVRPYKASLFFFWMLLLLLLLFAAPGRSIRIFPLVAVPSAVFIPLFFKKRIDRVSNLAYLLLFGSVVCYNLLPFLLGE